MDPTAKKQSRAAFSRLGDIVFRLFEAIIFFSVFEEALYAALRALENRHIIADFNAWYGTAIWVLLTGSFIFLCFTLRSRRLQWEKEKAAEKEEEEEASPPGK